MKTVLWNIVELPAVSAFTAAAYGNGVWVATDTGGNAWRSTDGGQTWASVATLVKGASCIIWDGSYFIAVLPSTAVAYSSPDGITWTKRNLPSNKPWSAVAYNPAIGKLVAVQSNGGTGYTRTPNANGSSWGGYNFPVTGTWVDIVGFPAGVEYYANFIVLDSGGRILLSADAKNWVSCTNDAYISCLSADLWVAISVSSGSSTDPTYFCAISASGSVAYGKTLDWYYTSLPLNADGSVAAWTDVCANTLGVFCAVSGTASSPSNAAAFSLDYGQTWTRADLPQTGQWNSLATDGENFLATGQYTDDTGTTHYCVAIGVVSTTMTASGADSDSGTATVTRNPQAVTAAGTDTDSATCHMGGAGMYITVGGSDPGGAAEAYINLDPQNIRASGSDADSGSALIYAIAPSDLSPAIVLPIAEARKLAYYQPVWLVEITPMTPGAPTLRVADRNIFFGGKFYVGRLDGITGISGELKLGDARGINPDVTLKFSGEGIPGYDYMVNLGDTYPFEGAAVVVKEIGLVGSVPTTDYDIAFSGIMDEPSDITPRGFSCKASWKLAAMDELWQQRVIGLDTWPQARTDAIGRYENIVAGLHENTKCQCVVSPGKTTLAQDIAVNQSTFDVTANINETPLTTGPAFLGDEAITIQSIAGSSPKTLVVIRNADTQRAWPAGTTIQNIVSAVTFLAAGHPVKSIGNIYVRVRDKLILVGGGVFANINSNGTAVVGFLNNWWLYTNVQFDIFDPGHTHGTSGVTNPFWCLYDFYGPAYFDQVGWPLSMLTYQIAVNGVVIDSVTGGVRDAGYPKHQSSSDPLSLMSDVAEIGVTGPAANLFGSYVPTFHPGSFPATIDGVTGVENSALTEIKYAGVGAVAIYDAYTKINLHGSNTAEVVSEYDVYADVTGWADPDGTYGGVGTAIQNPAWAIKYFLLNMHKMVSPVLNAPVFQPSEIDPVSFAATAAYMSANGYKFGFCVSEKISPAQFVKEMAFECRCTLDYWKGMWYLNPIPDSAPAPVRTLTRDDLAGADAAFVFARTPRTAVYNYLVARFKDDMATINVPAYLNSGQVFYREQYTLGWMGISRQSDALDSNDNPVAGSSIATYGLRQKDLSFKFIRDQHTADSVLALYLKLWKQPLMTVAFSLFPENFDLAEGDTIEIDDPVYSGLLWFIEKITRQDKGRIQVQARLWWGQTTAGTSYILPKYNGIPATWGWE